MDDPRREREDESGYSVRSLHPVVVQIVIGVAPQGLRMSSLCVAIARSLSLVGGKGRLDSSSSDLVISSSSVEPGKDGPNRTEPNGTALRCTGQG